MAESPAENIGLSMGLANPLPRAAFACPYSSSTRGLKDVELLLPTALGSTRVLDQVFEGAVSIIWEGIWDPVWEGMTPCAVARSQSVLHHISSCPASMPSAPRAASVSSLVACSLARYFCRCERTISFLRPGTFIWSRNIWGFAASTPTMSITSRNFAWISRVQKKRTFFCL